MEATDLAIVAARIVHFVSAMLLFGLGVFVFAVATPLWRPQSGMNGEVALRNLSLALRLAAWSLAASFVSAVAWLCIEAAIMSGLAPAAISTRTLGVVLGNTVFGRIWIGRFVLLLAMGTLVLLMARVTRGASRRALGLAATLAAAAYLATLAWSGHAAAQASGGIAQTVADMVHLLAAGAWLGALPGLVFLLGRSQPLAVSAELVRRFSILGIASVGALTASGAINSWYLVGNVPALIGTNYGWLILAKLSLFAAMLGLAAVNRFSLTAQLATSDPTGDRTLRSLRTNACVELAIGVIVVAIVGVLGVIVPAAHQSPRWPFDFTLSWQKAAQQTVSVGATVVATWIGACFAAAVTLASLLRRKWRQGFAGLIACVAASAAWGWMLAVPAYPTTYALSPERYTTDAVDRGATLYSASCSVCHGPSGRGDGPAAASPGIVPTDLAAHASGHRAGELFWWIAHGIPGTPMPAFSPRLSDAEIWDLVHFLRAQSDAATAASTLGEQAQPWVSAIVAPDFTFERRGIEQESIQMPQAKVITLVIFYTLPQSLPYLRELDQRSAAYDAVGLRIVAIPLAAPAHTAGTETAYEGVLAQAEVRADVLKAYSLYARKNGDSADLSRTQFDYLIDRQGYLRARWLGVPESAATRAAAVFDQAELLYRERQRAPVPGAHLH